MTPKRAYRAMTQEYALPQLNVAFQKPENSLGRVFADPSLCASLVQLVGADDIDCVMTRDGCLRPEIDSNQIRATQVCVGITDMVQPIHLYGIGRKEVATTGVRHPRRENEGADAPLRVWCDGSKDQSGKVGFAVWFHEGHPWNHSQRIADGSENFTAELHAAISALLLHDPNRDFKCYWDCEKVVQVLNDRSRTLPRHPLEAGWLQAARDVQVAPRFTRTQHNLPARLQSSVRLGAPCS